MSINLSAHHDKCISLQLAQQQQLPMQLQPQGWVLYLPGQWGKNRYEPW